MKESRLEHCLKLAVKGNGSVLKGSTECAMNEKQKDSAQKETLIVSVTRKINVEQQRAHSLLPRTADSKRWEKTSRVKSLGGRSPSGKRSRRPSKDYM